MHTIPRLRTLLDERHVAYEVLGHSRDYTAQETAAHTHTRGREFAKAVIVRAGDGYVMAVLPAHHEVDLERLGAALGHGAVELASEEEIARVCPDCEPGAIPPFGNLWELSVVASLALTEDERITCNAGSHREAIRLAWNDFRRVVEPRLLDFSRPAQPAAPRGAPERG
jgi:Ala-tRNA(Pro) deacylase